MARIFQRDPLQNFLVSEPMTSYVCEHLTWNKICLDRFYLCKDIEVMQKSLNFEGKLDLV